MGMTRLIDVDALNKEFIDFIRASNNSGIMPNWNDAVSLVGSAPTVDIVRCVDCKHRDAENGFCEGRGCPMQLVSDDGFCDKGERSEA